MRNILIIICVLLQTNILLAQHIGNFKYVFTICSGDSARLGIPPQDGVTHIWPEINPFYEYYGDTVGVYLENPGSTAIVIETFITRFYINDGNVLSDTLIINILPEIEEILPELNYTICLGDTVQVYYPYVPYGYMYTEPDSSSFSSYNEGETPRIDLYPSINTTYNLFIANNAGCKIGPFNLIANVQSTADSLILILPDSICYNSEQFEIVHSPSDATIWGPGVINNNLFLPELAGPGLHSITMSTVLGVCEVSKIDSIYLVSESEVIFPELPNPCKNDPKFELTGGSPSPGVYLGEGVDELGFLNPNFLEPGNHVISYNFIGADECRIQKNQSIFIKSIPPKPEIIFIGDSIGCVGDTLVLSSSISSNRYEWSTGDTTQNIQAYNFGLYYVYNIGSNNCRNKSDTIQLNFNNLPLLELLSPVYPNGFNTSYNYSSDGSIELTIEDGAAPFLYLWSNGATTQNLDNILPGSYSVSVTDANGCATIEEITLTSPDSIVAIGQEPFDLGERTALPNTFSPNGDGFNDTYCIPGATSVYAKNTFRVWNILRQLVYQSSNYSNNWDGRDLNGDLLPAGTYFGVFECNKLKMPAKISIDLRYN